MEEFEILEAAQLRALDADGFAEYREALQAECLSAESQVGVAELRSAAQAVREEAERRSLADSLGTVAGRAETAAAVASGRGAILARSNAQAAEPAAGDPLDSAEYREAFMEYVCRGTAIPMELRAANDPAGVGTMTTDVPAMIPTTTMNQIVEKMSEYGVIWNKVTKLNVQGGIEFPVLDLKPTAAWIGEDETSDYQKLEADEKVSFMFHTLECRLAQSTLASVTTYAEFQRRFVPLVAEAMVRALDQAVIRGDGKGKPLGIVNDPRIENVVEMTAAEFADWKAWHKKVKAAMPISYRNGEFIMCQSSFDCYVETMSDDNNAPVSVGYNPVTGEEQRRLVGKAVDCVEPDILPDFDAAKAGDVVAIFGNLGNYAFNSQMNLQTVQWVDHETNKVKYKSMLIGDGKVLDPYGFMLIKKKASA